MRRGGSWLWQASSWSWYESQPPAVYVLLPSSRQSPGPSCSPPGGQDSSALAGEPSALRCPAQAWAGTPRAPRRGVLGCFGLPQGRACRVWPQAAGWERDSALSSPCLSSQDLKFNSISKEINFKVAFYARVVCALPGQRHVTASYRWTRSVSPTAGGLAGSPSFGVQGCVLLACQEPARAGKVRPGCPGCELRCGPVGRLGKRG